MDMWYKMNKTSNDLTKQQRRELFAGYIFAKVFYQKSWRKLKPRTLLAIADIHDGYGTLKAMGMAKYARELARNKGGATCKKHLQQYCL